MPFDFPNNPAIGAIAQSPGGIYKFDGVKWSAGSTWLPLAGGTISPGPLHINAPSPNAAGLFLESASGYTKQIVGATITSPTTTSARWQIQPGNQTAEATGNVGSDFAINRYDNTGALLGTPFFISRATGQISVAQVMHVNSAGIDINSTYAQVVLNKAAGTTSNYNSLVGNVNGVIRWQVQPGTGEAESTGNAGSNFGIYRYDDAGNYLGNPFSITRSNGIVGIGPGGLYNNGPLTQVSGINFGSAIASGVTDLSRHINLYGLSYGFSITSGQLNYISGSNHVFYNSAGTWLGTFSASLLNLPGNLSAANVTTTNNVTVNGTLYGQNANAAHHLSNLTVDATLAVNGDSVQHNIYVQGTSGLNFQGVYNSGAWFAFGWDGTALNYAINGGGQGQLYTVGQNDNRYLYKTGDTCSGQFTTNSLLQVNSNMMLAGGIMYVLNNYNYWFGRHPNGYWYFTANGTGILRADDYGNTWVSGFLNCQSNGVIYSNVCANGFNLRWDSYTIFVRVDNAVEWALPPGSDERIKTDIAPSTFDCLAAVRATPLFQFRWREGSTTEPAAAFTAAPKADAPLIPVGFVAQRQHEVFPDSVIPGDVEIGTGVAGSTQVWAMNHNTLCAALCGAVQQLVAMNEELAARVAALETRTLH